MAKTRARAHKPGSKISKSNLVIVKAEQLTLLSTTELLDPLLIIVLTVEAHTDTHANIILHAVSGILVVRINPIVLANVRLPLNDQPPTASGNQSLKHIVELARHLLESPLDGFVLALIEHGDEFIDRFLRGIEVFQKESNTTALYLSRDHSSIKAATSVVGLIVLVYRPN